MKVIILTDAITGRIHSVNADCEIEYEVCPPEFFDPLYNDGARYLFQLRDDARDSMRGGDGCPAFLVAEYFPVEGD